MTPYFCSSSRRGTEGIASYVKGFHNAEEGQKDQLRWYEAIWKSPKVHGASFRGKAIDGNSYTRLHRIFVRLQGVEPALSPLCTGFHNAEEGQKDQLRWYEAIWKSPNIEPWLLISVGVLSIQDSRLKFKHDR